MANLTREMERAMVSLRGLNKKSDVDDSPLWNVVAAHLNATLISVEGGFRGERDPREAIAILAEYDSRYRGRKKARKKAKRFSSHARDNRRC